MQHLEANETTKKVRKIKEEIKRELRDLLINGEINENKDIEEKASKAVKSEDPGAVIEELEEIIRRRKVISYGWHTSIEEYFKISRKNRNLSVWYMNSAFI